MVIQQGEIYWADLGEPRGSEPGYSRPVVIVQSDLFNRSRIRTIVGVALTSNQALRAFPGNVRISAAKSGLDRDSVVNVSQIATLDRQSLGERIGRVPANKLERILDGINLVLGR